MLQTLGKLKVEGADFRRPKPLLLLVYVALEGPKPRRHLAELFWPGSERGMRSLSMALSQLRQALPEVKTHEDRVWSAIESDVGRLRQALGEGDVAGALSLYQGPFLEGFRLPDWSVELEEWVCQTRETLVGELQAALLHESEALAAKASFEAAAKRAQTALLLPGAPALEPDALRRAYTLLRAGDVPQAKALSKETKEYGFRLRLSVQEAQDRLRLTIPNNLPTRSTPFIGRDLERAELSELLSQYPLVTLLGSAGVGKSRLAVQAACEQLKGGECTGGIYFIALDALASPQLIPTAIAGALGVTLSGSDDPLARVLRFIADKKMLLVLDNYEHLMDGAAIASELIHRAPHLKLLVTSRERLNLAEERVLPLEGLLVPEVPIPFAAAKDFDALRLFAERAERARPGFVLTEENLSQVVRICQLVEGYPLAIELAAVWVRLMSCAEIAGEIEKNLDFLTTSTRNIPERHKSIRATFEHSWTLLSSQEQEALRKLSVFRGGFRREAAGAVAGVTLPVLASLMDKSLLRLSPTRRYDRHPLLYQYAQEKLAAHPQEKAQTEERHGLYYLRFVRERAWQLRTQQRKEMLKVFEEELANIRKAWSWATTELRIEEIKQFALSVSSIYENHNREGVASFAQTASRLDEADPAHHAALGYALIGQAEHQHWLGVDPEASIALAKRGLALLRPLGEEWGVVRGLLVLGWMAWSQGDFAEAKTILQEGLSTARQHGNPKDIGELLIALAVVERDLGTFYEARQFMQGILNELRDLGDLVNLAHHLLVFGAYLVSNRRLEEGRALLAESLRLARDVGGEEWLLPFILIDLARASYLGGESGQAEALLQEALELAEEREIRYAQAQALAILGRVATARGDYLGAEGYLEKSLRIGWTNKRTLAVTHALVFVAELRAAQGRTGEAVTYLALASHHPAIEKRDRDEARRLLGVLRERLPSKELQETVTRAEAMNLAEVVEEVLRHMPQHA